MVVTMTHAASSFLISGILILGVTVSAHAQGTGQVMYGNPNYNRTVVVGSPAQVGASNPVPTGMGPLSQPMPPAGSYWGYRSWKMATRGQSVRANS